MAAVTFTEVPGGAGAQIVEGHGHAEQDLRDGLATALGGSSRAELAGFQETWYNEQHGFGHDCDLHQDVDRALWSPGCGTFRPVTVAHSIPPAPAVRRIPPRQNGASDAPGGGPPATPGTATGPN